VKSQNILPLVAVIATGGTIASKKSEDGSSKPSLTGENLLSVLPDMQARLKPVELMAKDSSSLTLADMQDISDEVGRQLRDPDIAGVVILHGTDAMEETALLVHLQHKLNKPVILTGAQFTADHPDADGPANLAAAIALAVDPANAKHGVLLGFGGSVLSAWGLYKYSADKADAFRLARPDICPLLDTFEKSVSNIRVDIAAIYPGCHATHLDASLIAGVDGIVLAALGSGNANPEVVQAVKRCSDTGIPVVVSSRVPTGLLVPGYGGGGGGYDMGAAGAVHSKTLRPGQARVLLAVLVANGVTAEVIANYFGDL
jgi:L-asparaginase